MPRTADEPAAPVLPENPSPEDRATYVVMRLEQFVREGRTPLEGMPLRKWQTMALTEIAANITDAQNEMIRKDPTTNRLLFTTAASLITIGFWGTAVSVNKVGHLAAALVCGFAGAMLLAVASEWSIRKFWRKYEARKRSSRLKNIESLNHKIKRLESQLEQEAKDLEEALESTGGAGLKID